MCIRDSVYRMDFSQMLDAHIESGRSCTVAAIRQPIELSDQFGVIETDPSDPTAIKAFVEKPKETEGLADDPSSVLASMGNYIFTADALVEALREDDQREDSKHDMGGDIMPYFADRGEAAVYDFTYNDVPGSTDRDRQYWRDVGTLDSYYDAHMDLLRPMPIFNLYNEQWRLFTHQVVAPPAKLVRGPYHEGGVATDSILSPGVIVAGGRVQESILSPRALVGNHARVAESVLMHNVKVEDDAVVERCIVDKNVVIPQGVRVGVNPQEDRERGLTVTESGITVIPKNFTF